MKLLAFTDLHGQNAHLERIRRAIARHKPDVVACVGDFTVFGRSTREMLSLINDLAAPVILIHGNHEDEDEVRELLPLFPNIHFVHLAAVELFGITFVGFGGGGFSRVEPVLERFAKQHPDVFGKNTVILCHAPPYETLLDEVDVGWHVGCETLSSIIRRHRPLLALSGHIHECFHVHDTLAGVTLINPGPDGELIEIDDV